jgi:cyclopropane-fatty-acyl-phospholipid synthase
MPVPKWGTYSRNAVKNMDIEVNRKQAEHGLDHHVVQWFLNQAGNPNISMRLWTGDEVSTSGRRPAGCIELRSRRALLELLHSPSMGLGECYSKGLIDVHGDILAVANEITAALTRKRSGRYYGPKARSMLHAISVNSKNKSRHNVHHHYDLGNDFYKLWLDERMVYTCAYFEDPTATLDEAQVAKLDHVCRKLNLQRGQVVVEAGCGWGALAMHMAEHYGVRVFAYNLSSEQIDYAKEQAKAKGLGEQVCFLQEDYRDINTRCDAFVSIGMLEHVGLANYGQLGALIERCLRSDGIGLIHTIGRSYSAVADPWLTKYIFPGGHIPSLSETMSVFEPYRFSILDVENLRPHYARTCANWLDNFEAEADQITAMYGEEFVRMWRLYLAGSSASFQSGTLQLFQILFAPRGNNQVPWTRKYQYQPKERLS